jgi:hypothetical protein
MDYKWTKLILVVNFLFGLRVNEIPNETFILDFHQSFLCTGGEGRRLDSPVHSGVLI